MHTATCTADGCSDGCIRLRQRCARLHGTGQHRLRRLTGQKTLKGRTVDRWRAKRSVERELLLVKPHGPETGPVPIIRPGKSGSSGQPEGWLIASGTSTPVYQHTSVPVHLAGRLARWSTHCRPPGNGFLQHGLRTASSHPSAGCADQPPDEGLLKNDASALNTDRNCVAQGRFNSMNTGSTTLKLSGTALFQKACELVLAAQNAAANACSGKRLKMCC